MRRSHEHQDDLIAGCQDADAVNHAGSANVKARKCGVYHRLDGGLGHAGVMFQLHGTDALAVTGIPHGAYESDHRAYAPILATQGQGLGAEIKVFGLNAHAG